MDVNLRFWRAEGQSFLQRFLLWTDVLDPLLLLKSSDEIRRTRLSIQSTEKTLNEPIQNAQTKQAFLLSLSSVHPDTDNIIPVLFRPPAFLPVSLPLVVASSLQHQARHNFFCQFLFHAYTTGFTLSNGNGTPKAEEYSVQQKQIFLSLGAVSYAACVGAFPLVFMNRYTLKSPFTHLVVKKLLPAPLLGLMSAFTVVVARSPEFENGIEVMDRNGKVVGVSQKAGEKRGGSSYLTLKIYGELEGELVRVPRRCNRLEEVQHNFKRATLSKTIIMAVKETAISRGVLFGTTFFLPSVVMYLVERAKTVKTPRTLALMRMFVITSVLTGMLPVSLSMFSQCGEIKRADLEPEILSSTEETEFFYNRGI